MFPGKVWQDSTSAWGHALLEAIAESSRAALLNKSNAASSVVQKRLAEGPIPSQEGEKLLNEGRILAPVPGVVAVVYEEFFLKGSAVAVQLLKVRLLTKSPVGSSSLFGVCLLT